jgi:leucyl aminopeptidase
MKARLSTRTESGSTPVFVLKEDATITRHPSFQELEVQDRDFLAAFLKKSPVKDGHSHLVFLPSTREAILLGVAVRGNFTHRKAILAARRVVAFTRRERVRKISVSGADFEATAGAVRLKPRMALRVLGTQLTLANFEFLAYKTPPKEGWNFVEQISIVVPRATSELSEALQCGVIIGEETNRARALSNTPGGDMTPEMLAEIAMIAGRETGFSVTVLGVPEMEKLGMGGILGVGKGSSAMPRFIVIEYLKGKKHDAPVVLVGKGVTFDSGGLNLKPEASLYEMHMDMSGACKRR